MASSNRLIALDREVCATCGAGYPRARVPNHIHGVLGGETKPVANVLKAQTLSAQKPRMFLTGRRVRALVKIATDG